MTARESRLPASEALRVAVLGGDIGRRERLRSGLRCAGFSVPFEGTLASYLKRSARLVPADLLLVGLEESDDQETAALDALLERREPMLFSDALYRDEGRSALGRLTAKIHQAVAKAREPVHAPPSPAIPGPGGFPVWVLGASFGGPEMITRFLAGMPKVPPGAFIVAQHIGEGFAEVLAAQLHRSTPPRVRVAREGESLRPGQVYVIPVHRRLALSASQRIGLPAEPEAEQPCSPCIDSVMEAVAQRLPGRCGAVVFSGMGDDGRRGCEAIARAGGQVWAQDSASCAIDSMPRSARAAGCVTRIGTPEALAAELTALWRQGVLRAHG